MCRGETETGFSGNVIKCLVGYRSECEALFFCDQSDGDILHSIASHACPRNRAIPSVPSGSTFTFYILSYIVFGGWMIRLKCWRRESNGNS